MTAFASLVQDYLRCRDWLRSDQIGRMVALVGDAEMDEGNIYECLQEAWKHQLRNVWWIIDYNRQGLDGISPENLWQKIQSSFEAFDWKVVTIKYGEQQREAFARKGGESLRRWIDACPNAVYAALCYQGGRAWREQILSDLGDEPAVRTLLSQYSDPQIAELMANLGGHCPQSLHEAFYAAQADSTPTVFVAYTIKGWQTPLSGHKDNHSGLMTIAQMEEFRSEMQIAPGKEWDRWEGFAQPETIRQFLRSVPFFHESAAPRRFQAPVIAVPACAPLSDHEISTQAAFGKLLANYANSDSDFSSRIVTTAPDVTVSTNLGPWVNKRGLYARRDRADVFRAQQVPSLQKWWFHPNGQHIELGIAEMNFFILLSALGISHDMFGQRLLPVGTVYDVFIGRGLDGLHYGCYQDSRFMLVGTPSGVTLCHEGGSHQSVMTPLIGMAQDRLTSFEPAFADELAAILPWAFTHMQRSGAQRIDPQTCLKDESGGSVYLRLSTRPIEQPRTRAVPLDPQTVDAVIAGAYWWRKPQSNCRLVLIYQGCVAPEVLSAAGRLAEKEPDVGVLAVTSADRLYAGWTHAQQLRRSQVPTGGAHIEKLLKDVPKDARLITVIDGFPATLGWIGSVYGHRTVALGVSEFGASGSLAQLYAHFGIDTDGICAAARYNL